MLGSNGQVFLGSLWTKSEPIGEEKSEQEQNMSSDSQHGPNKVFIMRTILPISQQYTGKCQLSRQS